jgi:hypothetical protein
VIYLYVWLLCAAGIVIMGLCQEDLYELKRREAALLVFLALLLWPVMLYQWLIENIETLQTRLAGLSIWPGWSKWWDEPVRKSRGE